MLTSLHRPNPEALGRIRVVLVRPSHPGNVGAAARAMRVMGLRDLVVVSPRIPDAPRHEDAIAFASGATDVLERCEVVDTLGRATGEASLVVGVSAESREFGPVPETPEVVSRRVFDELAAHPTHSVALVFGTERTGLSIAEVGACQLLCSIPGDPHYCSLNLAQAVQLVAYVFRREAMVRESAQGGAPSSETTARDAAAPGADSPRWASHRDVEAFLAHFERALVAIRFLDPAHPKKLMARMRRLFGRTRLENEEVQLLRGVCRQAELAARGELPGARPPQAR